MMLALSKYVAMSACSRFLKAAFIFLAYFPHPFRGSLLQFGMVFVLPCAGCALESLYLPAAHEFLFGGLGQEAAAMTASYQGVDVLDQLIGEEHMRASDIHIRYRDRASGPSEGPLEC